MRNNHKAFISYYLSNGFNGALAYRQAYNINKEDAYCDDRASVLLKREDIKKVINSKVAELSSMSKEEFILSLQHLTKNLTKEASLLRAKELEAKLRGFTQDTSQQQVTNIIDYNKLVKEIDIKRSFRDTTT